MVYDGNWLIIFDLWTITGCPDFVQLQNMTRILHRFSPTIRTQKLATYKVLSGWS